MTSNVWTAISGAWTNRLNWSSRKVPQAGDTDIIHTGTVHADNLTISRQDIVMAHLAGRAAMNLQLNNSQIAPGSTLTVQGDATPTTISFNGNSSLQGTTNITSGHVDLQTGANSTGTIGGTFTVGRSASVTVKGNVTNAGHMQINSGGKVEFTGAINQTKGDITVADGGILQLDGGMSNGMIHLGSSTLKFMATPMAPISIAASHCLTSIEATGPSSTLDMGQTVAQAIYDSGTKELLITVPAYGGVLQDAHLHLVGSYSQADFTVHGSTVTIAHHIA